MSDYEDSRISDDPMQCTCGFCPYRNERDLLESEITALKAGLKDVRKLHDEGLGILEAENQQLEAELGRVREALEKINKGKDCESYYEYCGCQQIAKTALGEAKP